MSNCKFRRLMLFFLLVVQACAISKNVLAMQPSKDPRDYRVTFLAGLHKRAGQRSLVRLLPYSICCDILNVVKMLCNLELSCIGKLDSLLIKGCEQTGPYKDAPTCWEENKESFNQELASIILDLSDLGGINACFDSSYPNHSADYYNSWNYITGSTILERCISFFCPLELLNDLLQHGANPNVSRSECTALCTVTKAKNTEAVKLLLDHGAKVDEAALTALRNCYQTARVEWQAIPCDEISKLFKKTKFRQSEMSFLAGTLPRTGCCSCVSVLSINDFKKIIQRARMINEFYLSNKREIRKLASALKRELNNNYHPSQPLVPNQKINTLVEQLLALLSPIGCMDKKFDTWDIKFGTRFTLLEMLICYKYIWGVKDVVQCGATITPQALNNAIIAGDVNLVRFLIDNGANVNGLATNFEQALLYGDSAIVNLLLDNNIIIKKTDIDRLQYYGHLDESLKQRIVEHYQNNLRAIACLMGHHVRVGANSRLNMLPLDLLLYIISLSRN